MNLEHANAALFAALAAAQTEIENATKASVNPHFKSRYADLAEVLNTVRPVFGAHGLAIIQSVSTEGQLVTVMTAVTHKEGGHITSSLSCVAPTPKVQDLGSITTYLRRYSAAAMAAISQEDDDGNANAQAYQRPAPRKPAISLPGLLSAITATGTDEQLEALREQIRSLTGSERQEAIAAFTERKAALAAETKE